MTTVADNRPAVRTDRRLSRSVAFAAIAAVFVTFAAASAAPSPLYVVYQHLWGFSPTTLTVVFAVYVLGLIGALLTLGALSDHVRGHLREFREIVVGAGVLMPDPHRPGVLFAGDVTLPYSYFFELPNHPFECAHRVGVRWDLDPATARPREYRAEELGVTTRGGWWLWAMHRLTVERHGALVGRINAARGKKQINAETQNPNDENAR